MKERRDGRLQGVSQEAGGCNNDGFCRVVPRGFRESTERMEEERLAGEQVSPDPATPRGVGGLQRGMRTIFVPSCTWFVRGTIAWFILNPLARPI